MSGNTHSIGDQIRSGLKGVHGAGEAIRGTVLDEVDKAFDPKSSSEAGRSKNQDIANNGLADVKAADNDIGHNHGVGTAAASSRTTQYSAATSSGTHAVAPGSIGNPRTAAAAESPQVQEELGTSQRF